MPHRRPPGGRHRRPANPTAAARHRRPKSTVAPAYLTAATVAAFAAGGLHVPSAIGSVRHPTAPAPTVQPAGDQPTETASAASVRAAAALRAGIARQDGTRTSRLRHDRKETLLAAQETVRRARRIEREAQPSWVLPVVHYRLTAGFGDLGLWSGAHTGQDFAAPTGTPVRAVGAGTVVSAGYDGAYGNKIVIRHPDGVVTWYAHLSAFVRSSGSVRAGEVIGRVGSTGNVTGPHLHFEVRPRGGAPVSPLTWLREHNVRY